MQEKILQISLTKLFIERIEYSSLNKPELKQELPTPASKLQERPDNSQNSKANNKINSVRRQVKTSIKNKNFKTAIDLQKQVVHLSTDKEKATNELSRIYIDYSTLLISRGRFKDALKQVEKSLQCTPGYPIGLKTKGQIYIALAEITLQKRDFGLTSVYLKQAETMTPDNAVIYLLRGNIAYFENKYHNSEYNWKKALRIDPQLKEAKEGLKKLSKEKKTENEYNQKYYGNVLIKFKGNANSEVADAAVKILKSAYSDVGGQFSFYPQEIIVVIIYPKTDLKKLDYYPDWAAGLYDGKIRVGQDLYNTKQQFKSTLYHEYVHVLVHRQCGRSIPLWLNEGLAEYITKPFESKEFIENRKKMLVYAAQTKNLIPIQNLTAISTTGVYLFYAEAESFVSYLADQNSLFDVLRLLKELGKGKSLQNAVPDIFHCKLSVLSNNWQNSLLSR